MLSRDSDDRSHVFEDDGREIARAFVTCDTPPSVDAYLEFSNLSRSGLIWGLEVAKSYR